MPPPTDLITVDAAAELLHCHRATVYRLMAAGKLASWKRGRSRFVSRADALTLFTPVGVAPPLPAETTRAKTARQRRTEEVLKKAGML